MAVIDTSRTAERNRGGAPGADAEGAGQSGALSHHADAGRRQVCITQEIVETTPLAQSTVSQHLKVLREAGLIEGEVEGPATCYCLSEAGVRWLKEQIEGWLPGCCEPGSRVASAEIKPCASRMNRMARAAAVVESWLFFCGISS